MRSLLLVVLVCLASLSGAANERERIRFDADWRFFRLPPSPPPSMGPFHWSWKAADGTMLTQTTLPPDLESGNWRPVRVGRDVFRGRVGYAWFKTDIGTDAKDRDLPLHFDSVDDNAAVFLNGRPLLIHRGWDDPFEVKLGTAWKPAGPNELVVLVENTAGGGGIMGPVDFQEPPKPQTIPPESAPGFDDRTWRSVHLPHDYVAEGTFDEHGDVGHGSLPVGEAWYRKTFTVAPSEKGRTAWIDFDGVYRNSTVWLNGHKLGNHPGGYDGFRYIITPWLKFGSPNELAVLVDGRESEGWWYEGGGIYRHVWLNFASPVHVRPWGTYVVSSLKEPTDGHLVEPATLTIQTDLDNDMAVDKSATVDSTILDPDGLAVGSSDVTAQAQPSKGAHLVQTVHVSQARLWSIGSPSLYRLRTTVEVDGKVVDKIETAFGIRTLRYDPDKGFFLNGTRVELQGTCNHQDHAGVGIAIPDDLFRFRIARLKEMGSNAYRCSHNPPASELLDQCDRQGMVVMDENRHLGDTERPKSSEKTPYGDLSELKGLVLRDRNHPSVIMWSMCNEEGIQGTPAGARIFAAMKKVTNDLDPTRPVTCAMNGGWGTGISLVEDLQGINYGTYGYDRFHKDFPTKPVYGSETASTVSTRGVYANDAQKGYVSAYDVNAPSWGATAEGAWKPIAERPWFEGGFVWTGFDYKGEPTPYGWPCINSHFGIMDICGFPKDNFYYYQAWWGSRPIVHILPHWNWKGKEGQPINVWCYSNADKVELFLNGASLGAKDMPRYGHLEWSVDYVPGQLLAKAYRNGQLIASDSVTTTSEPVALRLIADRHTLLADGEDVAEVEVEVLDTAGRVVPDAGDLVQFSVAGPASVVGVGNGDPSSHEPDKSNQRHAFNGLCMALVGAASAPGRVVLTASAAGLRPASVTFGVAR